MSPERLVETLIDAFDGPNTFHDDDDEDEDLVEPVAVIGFSVKFPQDASSSAGFWKLMAEKRSAMTEIPADRFHIDAFYHPTRRDALPLRGAHFIKDDLGAFDAEFFGINPSEAAAMDPAQRILLETTYKACESAGIRLEHLKGSNTSVHTGCFTNDYLQQLLKDPERLPTYAAVGATLSMLANRISWFYDLSGPSINVDSACSSSAMAIDHACQLLRAGDSGMSIVAGCNLTFDPDYTNVLTNMQFLSHDSRSFPFDHRANGYSRGEGVGVVLLKPLASALRDNDTIRAVIRASGSNQDGRTPGITQPNSKAQTQLIRDTYRKAGLTMKHTRFFEAHGTGTPVGDPAEANTIVMAFQKYRSASDRLYVGAVKSNIGHLEGAAGIAGLIKTILVLEKGVIVPNANFESVNRRIDLVDSCLAFPTECVPWPQSRAMIRRASINCFGYGGSNCHLVVDDADSYLSRRGLKGHHLTLPGTHDPATRIGIAKSPGSLSDVDNKYNETKIPRVPKILVWSAASEAALQSVVSGWQDYFINILNGATDDPFLHDLAYTLDTRRSLLAWRSYAIVHSLPELRNILAVTSVPTTTKASSPRVAFIFTGQGAQWYAMGRELLQYQVFAEVIDEAEANLYGLGCAWSVREELLKSEAESRIDEPDLAQPLCAILQIGLVELMRTAGVVPHAVVGHSMGEIAAAYCAGAISRKSAFKLAYYRGLYVAKVPERSLMQGGMLAVGLSPTAVLSYFERVKARVVGFNLIVSCVNSPINITVSGEASQLADLEEDLRVDHVFARRLRVSAAYHSPQLASIADDCLQHFGKLEVGDLDSRIAMISTISASRISSKELLHPEYWVKNMISPVEFWAAVENLCAQSQKALSKKLDGSHREAIVVSHLIEIGPHAALGLPIREIISTLPRSYELTYSSTLFRKKSASHTFLQLLGNLHCMGYPVDLRSINEVNKTTSSPRMTLADTPDYPFNHTKIYWHESHLSRKYRFREHKYVSLLGNPVRDWNPLQPQWRCRIRPSELPWLADHKMGSKIVYPASALLSMAISAASQMADSGRAVRAFVLHQVRFQSAVTLSLESDDTETRLSMRPISTSSSSRQSSWEFVLFAMEGESWSQSCSGIIEAAYDVDATARSKILSHYQSKFTEVKELCAHKVTTPELYNAWEKQGFHYGPTFQGITSAQHDHKDSAVATIDLSLPLKIDQDSQDYVFHPASLDSVMHLSLVALSRGATRDVPTQVPTSIDKLWISTEGSRVAGTKLRASARIDNQCPRFTTSSVFALNEEERSMLVILNGLKTSAVADYKSGRKITHNATDYIFKVNTVMDIEMLTSLEILAWLDNECGPEVSGPQEFCEDLHFYIVSVLQRLRSKFGKKDIAANRAYLARYLDWIDWQLYTLTVNDPCKPRRNTPIAQTNAQKTVVKFFVEIGNNLPKVLTGEVDVLQLLFENSLAKEFYEQQSLDSNYYSKIERFTSQLALKRSEMDVLEIGAGTGSFTKYMLRGLGGNVDQRNMFNQYTYTDVSPIFLGRAKEEFVAYAHKMNFRTLDIEEDFVSQGYQEASFDLIAASNVLHITKDLSTTLKAVRKLLRPGGRLILHETTAPDSLETGFVFGLLPGWWLGSEEYRSVSAIVTEEQWSKLLAANGFSGADFVLRDFADDSCHLMSIICTTAVEIREPQGTCTEMIIVMEASSSVQVSLAEGLQTYLAHETSRLPRITTLADTTTVNSSSQLLICLLDTDDPFFTRLTEDRYAALKGIMLSAEHVLWITNGGGRMSDPAFGMIDGFIKVIRIECPNLKITSLALDRSIGHPIQYAQKIAQVIDHIRKSSYIYSRENYLVVDNRLSVRRAGNHTTLKSRIDEIVSRETTTLRSIGSARPFSVNVYRPGDTSTLRIMADTSFSPTLEKDEVDIEVYAIGLDARDFLIARGMTSSGKFGSEGAGVVKAVASGLPIRPGDRVCFCQTGALRSTVRTKISMVARIPDKTLFSQAAILPNDYLCASYLIYRLIKVDSMSTILIHSGQTFLSRAAINLAIDAAFEVFVVVSTAADRAALEEVYHGKLHLLAHSDYVEQFRCIKPKGADAILDLSSGPISPEIFASVSRSGQVVRVEAPTRGIPERNTMPNVPLNVSFRTVDPNAVLPDCLDSAKLSLQDALGSPMAFKLSPFQNICTLGLSQIQNAVRSLEADDGSKLVIDLADTEYITLINDFQHTYQFDPYASYVIAGGFGDLGRCLTRWMVRRGARNLILLSRSGVRTDAARQVMKEHEEQNVRLWVSQCDISSRCALESTLNACLKTMPAIKGCIQASGALKDVMYENMTIDDWNVAVNPKVNGSWNLHDLLPCGMDFFIMTSSVTGILGQATQINYAAGNTYQDSLAGYRVVLGEKAISLDLGALLTGGLLSQNPDLLERFIKSGYHIPISESDILALMEFYCDPALELEQLAPSQVIIGIRSPADYAACGTTLLDAMQYPFWSMLRSTKGSLDQPTITEEVVEVYALLQAADTLAEAGLVVTDAVIQRFAAMLSMPAEKINADQPLHVCGADSLSAIELRNWILKVFTVDVPVFDLLGGSTIAATGLFIAKKWQEAQSKQA
ncbi:polyketide synthase [Xylographa bjoerkii]|nr:polyketide synthase [Xylographa bjoerkii]